MSRSIQKNPITGVTTAKSERRSKKLWAKRARNSADIIPKCNDRDGAKDGERYWSMADIARMPELLRK